MSGARRRKAFDTRDRARIRAALKRYMQDHRIGVPALKFRIEDASPSIIEFPLKTLQRFLADTHRTSDGYVTALYDFIKETKYWRPRDTVEGFGEAFFSFLNPATNAPQKDFNRKLLGRFLINETRAPLYAGSFQPMPTYKRFRIPPDQVGHIEFEWIDNPACLQALETRPLRAQAEAPAQRRKTYEGVLAAAQDKVFVFLRDTLTRAPRMYELSAGLDLDENNQAVDVLIGACFRTSLPYSPDDDDSTSKHRYVHLHPESRNRVLHAAE